jgi:hypothetical protein
MREAALAALPALLDGAAARGELRLAVDALKESLELQVCDLRV